MKHKVLIKNALKRQISLAFQKLPVSSKLLGPPKGYWNKTVDYVTFYSSGKHANSDSFLYEKTLKTRANIKIKPKTIYQKEHWKFDYEWNKFHYGYDNRSDLFTANLPRARVVGEDAGVIAHDDKLLLDISPQFGIDNAEKVLHHNAFACLKMPNCEVFRGTVATIATPGGKTFFHWITDALPKLFMLQNSNCFKWSDIGALIVPPSRPFILETLKYLGIEKEKLIFSDSNLHLEALNLVVASPHGTTGWPPKWAIDTLKERFFKLADSIPPSSERIYVSRSRAAYRKVANESQVVEMLSRYGFTSIILEELSFLEQVAVLRSAKVVVAPHGAGLTNLVWCDTKTKVLEIFSRDYVNVCFWSLCQEADLDYYYILGDGEDPGDYIDPHLYKKDITVKLSDLNKALELLL